MTQIRQGLFGLACTIAVLLLSGCQPTPEERLSRAEQYLADADYRTATIELRILLQAAPDDRRARLLLAQTSYQLGDFSDAVSQYERAIGLGETDAATWVALGRALLSQGRAVDAFERVVPNLESSVGEESTLVFLGDVQFSMKNMNRADAYYEQVLLANPTSVGGLIGRAMVLANAGNLAEARQLLDSASEVDADASSVWQARGQIYQASRQYEDAVKSYENALRLQSSRTLLAEQFSTRVSYVSALIDSRQLDSAEQQLSQLTNRFPDHPVSGFLRGRIAFARGDYDTAQMALQDYLSKNPGDARGQAILGAITFSQDNLRQAESHLIAAVRANAGGEQTRRLLAETRLRLDNPAGALEILQSGDSLAHGDAAYLAMLGRAQVAAGDDDAAIEYFRQGVDQSPDNDAIRLALASTYLKTNQAEQAIAVLDDMPIHAGSELRRQTLLIAALIRQGDNDRAVAESRKLIEADPGDPSAHVVAGALWQSIGEPELAERAFEQALEIDPSNLIAQFSLSRIALASGDFVIAASRLQKLLDSHPAYVPALVALGMVLQEVDSLASLRPYVKKAMKSAPDSMAPYIILARLDLATGQPDAAIRAIDEATSKFEGTPDLNRLRGLALLAKGDFQAALRSLMAAASAAPDDAGIQLDLAKAQLANEYLDAAQKTATVYCELMPDDTRCPILLGDIELARGEGAAALRHFEVAAESAQTRNIVTRMARAHSVAGTGQADRPLADWLNEHPDDYAIRSMYARILESEGRLPEAIAQYEVLLAADQLGPAGMNNLAWQYSLLGNERAVEVAERAHALNPSNGSITDTLGWILAKEGQSARALPLLREAVGQSPRNPDIRFHLAYVLAKSGESAEAKEVLDELLITSEQFPSRADAEKLAESL